MKKNKTKILLGFGATTTLLTIGSVVLSCGISDQQKQDSTTAQMVANYVKGQTGFIPSSTTDAPTTAYSSTLDNATLNGVDGLTITIYNWVANISLGSVTFDASISRFDLITPNTIIGVTYDGWKTDQNRLNAVTSDMVVDYVKTQDGFIPSADADVPTTAYSSTLDNVTLNDVSGLTIIIYNWVGDKTNGSVTFDVGIFKTLLKNKNITGITYDGWNTDQKRLDAITAKTVADYVKTQDGFIPSPTADVPAAAPRTLNNETLNGVSGLTIVISMWTPDATHGSVTFDVYIFKIGFNSKNINGVTYDGWITNQNKLDGITAEMVANYVKQQTNFVPPVPKVDAPQTQPAGSPFSPVTLNGLDGLTIIISNWLVNASLGSVIFDVKISRGELTKNILGVTYDGYKNYTEAITHENVNDVEGKLWSFDNNTLTLNIFYGVTSIGSDDVPIFWGFPAEKHDFFNLAHINFPNTLKTIKTNAFAATKSTNLKLLTFPASLTIIDESAFSQLTSTSLKFLGAIPSASGRILTLVQYSFNNTPISNILAGDSGTTQEQWQAWAKTCHYAFKDK